MDNEKKLKKELQSAPEDRQIAILNELINLDISPEKKKEYAEQALRIAQKTENKKEQVEILCILGELEREQANFDESVKYLKESVNIAKDLDNYKILAESINSLARVFWSQSDFQNMLKQNLELLKVYTENNDEDGIAIATHNLGMVYRNTGQTVKALQYYLKALQIMKKLKNEPAVGRILNSIGIVYEKSDDPDKAFQYYNEAYEILTKIGNKALINQTLNNLGNILEEKGEYSKALQYYQKSLKFYEEKKNLQGASVSLQNIGYVYETLAKNEKALEHYKRSLELKEKLHFKKGIAQVRNNIASVLTSMKEYKNAEKQLLKALKIALEIDTKPILKDIYHSLYFLYQRTKKYKKALDFFEKLTHLNEQTHEQDIRERLEKLRIDYQKKQMDIETDILKKSHANLEKQVEKRTRQLKKNEQLYKNLFNFSPDCVMKIDDKGFILECNQSGLVLYGFARSKIIGKHLTDLMDEPSRDIYEVKFPELAKLRPVEAEITIKNKSGESINIWRKGVPIADELGNYSGALIHDRNITNRKLVENALLESQQKFMESEEKYRTLFESSRDAIMLLAPPSWKFTVGNPATVEMFKAKDEEEFIRFEPWELSPDFQPDRKLSSNKAREMIKLAMQNGSNFFEWTHARTNGETFPASVLLTKITIEGKEMLQATVRDISERKKNEEKLQNYRESLESMVHDRTLKLSASNEALSQEIKERKKIEDEIKELSGIFQHFTSNPKENIDLIVKNTCELLNGVCSLYNRLDDEEKSLLVWSAHNAPPDLKYEDVPNGHICYEATIKGKNKVVKLENLEGTEYEKTDENVAKYNLKSYLGYPVSLKGKAIGALCVVDIKPRKFSKIQIHIISTLAKALSIEEERLNSESELRESEDKFRMLFENSPDAVFVEDKQGFVLDVNEAGCLLHGLKREELIGKNVLDLVPEDQKERVALDHPNFFKKKVVKYEGFSKTADGQTIPVEIRSNRISFAGKDAILLNVRNITERRQIERELQKNIERLEESQSLANLGHYERNLNGGSGFWSDSFYRIFGYRNDEIPCRHQQFLQMVHPDDRDFVERFLEKSKLSGQSYHHEYRIIRKDKEIRTIYGIGKFVYDPDGKPISHHGTIQDITERKSIENNLKQSKKQYKNIFDNSPVGIVRFDIDGNVLEANRQILEILGSPSIEATKKINVLKFQPLIEIGFKDDFSLCLETGKTVYQEKLYTSKWEKHVYLRYILSPINAENKRIINVQGTFEDITEKKNIEKKLQKQKDYYLNFVESLSDWVWEMDTTGVHTYSNKAVKRLLGYLPEEIVGRNTTELWNRKTGSTLKYFYKTMSEGKGWMNITAYFKHKEGAVIAVESSAIPIFDDENKLLGYRGVDHDITDRLSSEETIKNNYDQQKLLSDVSYLFSKSDNFAENMNKALSSIGEYTKVSRVYVFENFDDCRSTINTFEWCSSNIKPQIDNLQNVSYELIPSWKKMLVENGIVCSKHIEELPKDVYDILEPQGIKSIFVLPIKIENEFFGFMGFDECVQKRDWTENEIELLKTIVNIITNFYERRKTANSLKKSQEQYKLLADHSSDIISLSYNNKPVYFSPAITRIYGYELEDVLENYQKLMHPDDLKKYLQRVENNTANKIKFTTHIDRFMTSDGEYNWFETNFENEYKEDGKIVSIGVSRNITERVKALEDLRTSEHNFRDLYNHIAGGVLIVGDDYLIKDVNERTCEITGFTREELIGQLCDIICPKGSGSKECPIWEHNADGFIGMDTAVKCKSGYKNPVLKNSKKLKLGNEKVIFENFQNLKDQKDALIALKESEDKLRKINENLHEQVQKEVEKGLVRDRMMMTQSRHAAMGEMLGNIAHQWRQPLNNIGLLVQEINDAFGHRELTGEKLNSAVFQAMEKIQYLSQTIDDFRTFFKPLGKKEKFDVKSSIINSIALVKADFVSKGIGFKTEFKEKLYVHGFKNEFSQVILNLINNSKDAFLVDKTEIPEISIELKKQNKFVVVAIEDNAGGIPEEIINRIFEPYFSTKEDTQGTGVGLYMSKEIIEKNMAGKITVKNTKMGVRFQIKIKMFKEKDVK